MAIESERIILAGAWVSLMLSYLLGDVMRIFAGDLEPGRIGGEVVAGWVWTVATAVMLLPIAMILTSLLAPAGSLRWITLVVAAGLFLFNLVGLPYKGFYDNMLLVIGLGLNIFTAWIAWRWQPEVV